MKIMNLKNGIMFKWRMMKNPWFSFDYKKNAINIKNLNFLKKQNAKIPKKKCMIRCDLMKKEGQKSLTLSVWRKPLNIWPRKRPKKKKKIERRDRERNRRDRQKAFEKVKSDSYLFLKIEIQSVEKNRAKIEFH